MILEFYTNFSTLKRFKNNPDLTKNSLKLEKALSIKVNKFLEIIKIAEGKVRELEYILVEKDKLLNNKFENQKEKYQFQDYRIKLHNIKDSIQEIKEFYSENIKIKLNRLWLKKPRTIEKEIKHLSKTAKILLTQSEEIELKLKEELEKKISN